ncbi:hypothetical protein D3C80_931960 [compost metagenome]
MQFHPQRIGPVQPLPQQPERHALSVGIDRLRLAEPRTRSVQTAIPQQPAGLFGQGQRYPLLVDHAFDQQLVSLLHDFLGTASCQPWEIALQHLFGK